MTISVETHKDIVIKSGSSTIMIREGPDKENDLKNDQVKITFDTPSEDTDVIISKSLLVEIGKAVNDHMVVISKPTTKKKKKSNKTKNDKSSNKVDSRFSRIEEEDIDL